MVRPYRLSNAVMRWVCLGVFSALILFVFSLFRVTLVHTFIRPVGIQVPESELRPRPPLWENFPFLTRYYGGVRTLVTRKDNEAEYPGEDTGQKGQNNTETPSKPDVGGAQRNRQPSYSVFNPYPNYTSPGYVSRYGRKEECFLDSRRKIRLPHVRHFDGIPEGFPDAIMGSNEVLGIRDDVCYDRFGRLGPYGLGYGRKSGGSGAGLEGDRAGIEVIWEEVAPVNFRRVNWAEAQDLCVTRNAHRFSTPLIPKTDKLGSARVKKEHDSGNIDKRDAPGNSTATTDRLPQSAFVIRTWHDFQYTDETILYLRALISELSLMSGGEYVVHFLIHVRDDNLPIWADDETHNRVLRDALPQEFRGMGSLWSERQMGLIYGGLEETFVRDLPVHGVYRSTFMPMQYFAHQHPEYDFFWNWEMDVRYTGHWYHLLDRLADWSRQQPRKGLWERNSRFYVPAIHGSWDDFRHMVRIQTEVGTNSPNNVWRGQKTGGEKGYRPGELQPDKPIWGPERPADQDVFQVDGEGVPPTTYEKDKYEWGVNEEADLIVLNPLFDPEGTTWLLKDDVTGYSKEKGPPPRRAAIITASRLSRKLLQTMHRETSLKRHTMFSEMWPATTCLHHGFKAVYAPHPMYIDRRWPPAYLESVFNGGRNGASGGARTSVFGEREHNFRGTTWFYSAEHAANLWNRWLGYKVNNDGGEEFELANEGRICLPPMLLHPVKEVKLIIESAG